MASSVGFIGGGRITRVILQRWSGSGDWPARVVVSDVEPLALEKLRVAAPRVVTVEADNLPPADNEVVFLALHPPALRSVLGDLRGKVPRDSLVVSLAPKVTMAEISRALGGCERVARAIPNAPSIVGAGFNPVAFAPGLPPADRQRLFGLLAPLGKAPEVAETDLETYALLTAMGPTYLWFQLYELLSLAKGFGLSEAAAAEALGAMVEGSVRTMLRSGLSPTDVTDLVPVRPMGDQEEAIKEAYRARLRGVLDKIRPAA